MTDQHWHEALTAAAKVERITNETHRKARTYLHHVMRAAMVDGMSAYRVSHITGISQSHVGRIRDTTP